MGSPGDEGRPALQISKHKRVRWSHRRPMWRTRSRFFHLVASRRSSRPLSWHSLPSPLCKESIPGNYPPSFESTSRILSSLPLRMMTLRTYSALTNGRISAILFGPIPGTRSSSSTEPYGRPSTIRLARVFPIPGRPSSSARLAVFRLTRPCSRSCAPTTPMVCGVSGRRS